MSNNTKQFSTYLDRHKSCHKRLLEFIRFIPAKKPRLVRGLDGELPNTIHLNRGFNEFDTEATRVPNTYEKYYEGVGNVKERFYNPELKKVECKMVPEYEEPFYFIHDNGGRPFVVYTTSDKKAVVYSMPTDEGLYISRKDWRCKGSRRQLYTNKVFETPYEYAFIDSGECAGNTILLHLGNMEYMFISSKICTFTSFSPIIKYYSPIRGSDVPYPVAEDATGLMYMMLHDTIMPKPSDQTDDNYYREYYKITKMVDYDTETLYDAFYIDDEPYMMSWNSKPGKEFDELTHFDFEETGELSVLSLIRNKGDEREILTRESFITLHNQFAEDNDLEKFETHEVSLDYDDNRHLDIK